MVLQKRKKILITMGDGAGIGPEIIVKALENPDIYENCKPLVIGDTGIMNRAIHITGSRLKIHSCSEPEDGLYQYGSIDLFPVDLLSPNLEFGTVNETAGHAAYCFIEKAVELITKKKADALCTAPLNKEALHLAGHFFPGHTEILAFLTKTPKYSMMFSSPELNVILVTIHDGLLDAIKQINPDNVYDTIVMAHEVMKKRLGRNPRIAVCGINPHAGENGLFGYHEEEKKIIPAIEHACAGNIQAEGPLPADTAFYLARKKNYDIVVSMYHDQGLGPIKVLGIESSVNITVGLPFIRTSVDHGTAFNIAGKNIADATNMEEAIKQAWLLSGETG